MILHNLLIHWVLFISDSKMPRKKAVKETKAITPKKTTKPQIKSGKITQKKTKEKDQSGDDAGIIIIDDEIKTDKALELEERRAYLEEAKSQESSD